MAATSLKTKVSTKGQVILPKVVRDRTGWAPGTTLDVELTRDGVLLTPASPFARTKPEDVRGMLRYDGPPKTIEEMDQGIMAEVRARHARGRY